MRLCSVDGCGRKHRRNGYCGTHSSRVRKHGDPNYERPSPESRFWSNVQRGDGCWIWSGHIDALGYGRFRIAGVTDRAHRAAWFFSNGRIPTGMEICHRCDNPSCVRPQHLFLGTHQENMDDMRLKGRSAPQVNDYRGTRNPRARLTEQQARHVKYSNDRVCDLAAQFGVPRETLYSIRNGKNWRHL